MSKKGLEFVLSKRDGINAFNLSFRLLLAKIDFVQEKQGYKKDTLVVYSSGYIKMVLTLSIKVVVFYLKALIV